jgi:hypothetical protein
LSQTRDQEAAPGTQQQQQQQQQDLACASLGMLTGLAAPNQPTVVVVTPSGSLMPSVPSFNTWTQPAHLPTMPEGVQYPQQQQQQHQQQVLSAEAVQYLHHPHQPQQQQPLFTPRLMELDLAAAGAAGLLTPGSASSSMVLGSGLASSTSGGGVMAAGAFLQQDGATLQALSMSGTGLMRTTSNGSSASQDIMAGQHQHQHQQQRQALLRNTSACSMGSQDSLPLHAALRSLSNSSATSQESIARAALLRNISGNSSSSTATVGMQAQLCGGEAVAAGGAGAPPAPGGSLVGGLSPTATGTLGLGLVPPMDAPHFEVHQQQQFLQQPQQPSPQQQQHVLQAAAAAAGAGCDHLVPVQLLQCSGGLQSPDPPLQLLLAPAPAAALPSGGVLSVQWGGPGGGTPVQTVSVSAAGLSAPVPPAAAEGVAAPVGVYVGQNQVLLMGGGSVQGVTGAGTLGRWPQSTPQPPGLPQEGVLLDASCMAHTTPAVVAPAGTLMGQAPVLPPVAWAGWDGAAGAPAPSGPMALAAGLQQLVLQQQYVPMGSAVSTALPPGW